MSSLIVVNKSGLLLLVVMFEDDEVEDVVEHLDVIGDNVAATTEFCDLNDNFWCK